MEPNLSGNQNDKMNANIRHTRDADQSIKPNLSPSIDSPIKDPVYDARATKEKELAKAKLSESYEGFSASQSTGMPNLENSDGFGSKYQMPGPDMSEKYMTKESSFESGAQKQWPVGSEVPPMEGFVDLQTSIQAIQHLVLKIRENLQSTEQSELEELMRQGAQLLSANWKQLTSTATEQVSTIKSDVKENPYRTVITALKVGMALGQVIAASRRDDTVDSLQEDEVYKSASL